MFASAASLITCWHGKQSFMNNHESFFFLLWRFNSGRYLYIRVYLHNFATKESLPSLSGLGFIVSNFSVVSSSVSNHNFVKLLSETALPLCHRFFPRLLSLYEVEHSDRLCNVHTGINGPVMLIFLNINLLSDLSTLTLSADPAQSLFLPRPPVLSGNRVRS